MGHMHTHTDTFMLSSGNGFPTSVVNAMLWCHLVRRELWVSACVCVSACQCVLLWLGVKKEVKPVKGAEGRKAEAKTKLVPAKRQHARKDTATVSTCAERLYMLASVGASCVVLLACLGV